MNFDGFWKNSFPVKISHFEKVDIFKLDRNCSDII